MALRPQRDRLVRGAGGGRLPARVVRQVPDLRPRGLAFRCPAAPNIGITAQGAYAQYVAVPARQLVALPPELPLELGSHAEPLSVGSQAVKLSGAGPGDPVLVYGVGPIGLYSIMALRLAGAGPIVRPLCGSGSPMSSSKSIR